MKTCFGQSFLPHAIEGKFIFGWIKMRMEIEKNQDQMKNLKSTMKNKMNKRAWMTVWLGSVYSWFKDV